MWLKQWCPSSEDFVSLWTLTKCGQKCALHWRTLSCSRLQPNVAQNVPLVGGLCHAAVFDQMWHKMCPSLEDFVMQWTLTKCGSKCAPHRRTLSCSGLQTNVAQNVLLVGGLCHVVDFIWWSKVCPSSEDFVMQRTLTKCGPKCAPHWRTLSHSGFQPNMVQTCALQWMTLFCYGVRPHMDRQRTHHRKQAGTKQTDSNHWSTQNKNRHLQLQCHVINMLRGIRANKPWQRNGGYCIHHATNDKWCGLHTTITNAASYLMREESILIVFTWTSWRFLRAYAGLLVDATMIALFGCQRLDQNGNGGAKANNIKSWQKNLIVSGYGRIRYYYRILLKNGHAPITNVISNTYCTVSVIPYWELMHQANPNIHRTPC